MKANKQVNRASKTFHKTDVYGYYRIINEKETVYRPVKFDGWSDGTFEYYANEERWHVIDPASGLSITTGDNRKQARANVLTKEIQEQFNDFKQTDKYKEQCDLWKQMMDKIKEEEYY